MRTAILGLLLCLGFLGAQASLFDHIWNHTKLRGKVNVDTSNGLKLGYNASLGYKDDFLGLDLGNIGVGLNAVPHQNKSEDGLKDTKYVIYSADFSANQGQDTFNATANGTAGIVTGFNRSALKDNDTEDQDYFLNLFHVANWWGGNQKYGAEGNHEARAFIQGNVDPHNNHTDIRESIEGRVITNGDIYGEEPLGNFSWVKGGKVSALKHVDFPGKQEEMQVRDLTVKPTAVFTGNANFQTYEEAGWNNESVGAQHNGVAAFSGVSWTQHRNNSDGSHFHGVAVDQDTEYKYLTNYTRNGKLVGRGRTGGRVDEIKNLGVLEKNGTVVAGLSSVGKVVQADQIVTNKTQNVLYNAGWDHTSRIAPSGDHVDVATRTAYEAQGKIDNKPFQYEVLKNATARFNINNHSLSVDSN